nr:upstream of flowering locus C [Gladiolus x hybridus]
MALSSSSSFSSRRWKAREISPERNMVWIEPEPKPKPRRVPVVYYLSRNGHLEHPHFMEVPLSSADGLYLRDVKNRLDLLRGKGMANLYSWSSKRSYKNGFVWHDLSEDDFIYPAHGHEYVLKGSEILLNLSQEPSFSSSSSEKASRLEEPPEFEIGRRKKKTPWSSLDLGEYKVYKSDLKSEASANAAADASTQTEEKLRHRRRNSTENSNPSPNPNPNPEREEIEISPPPSSSSPETLETLIKSEGRIVAVGSADDQNPTAGSGYASGRFKASAVLMQLISCGSISVREVGPQTASLSARPPRGDGDSVEKEMEEGMISSFGGSRLEDMEYFSGSLIEIKKKQETGAGSEFSGLRRSNSYNADSGSLIEIKKKQEMGAGSEFPGLRRSNSYNADRCSKLELAEKEIEGVRAKCIPRRLKAAPRREGSAVSSSISRSCHGSKRINVEPSVK